VLTLVVRCLDGIAWATSNGYTYAATIGYVLAAAQARNSTYSMGLSAAVPSIPTGVRVIRILCVCVCM
jgi:hypothetical protein